MANAAIADIREAILREVPDDGSAIGNLRLRERITQQLVAAVDEQTYIAARDELIATGILAKGQGDGRLRPPQVGSLSPAHSVWENERMVRRPPRNDFDRALGSQTRRSDR